MTIVQKFDFFFLSSPKTKQTFMERIICGIPQKTDVETKKASVSTYNEENSNN